MKDWLRLHKIKKLQKGKAIPKNRQVNLTDLTFTPEDLAYVNDRANGYCPKGICLENTKKAYDMTAGRLKGIPSSSSIWNKDLKIQSTATKPTTQQTIDFPYYRGDANFGSVDSWDIQGQILDNDGTVIHGDELVDYNHQKAPVGAI